MNVESGLGARACGRLGQAGTSYPLKKPLNEKPADR